MRIVDAEPWMLMAVALRLTERDVHEASLLGYKSVQDVAVRRSTEIGMKWAILDDQGDPQACFGVADNGIPGVGTMWLMRTDGAARYAKSGLKAIRAIIKSGEYRRVEAYAKADCEACRKFLRWLGFAFEGTKRAFFTDGTDMDQFAITRST